jgi:Cdc6-like AAA superfamily ATPase
LLQSQAHIVDLTEAYEQLATLVPNGPAPKPPAVIIERPRRPLGFNPVVLDFAERLLMDQAELVKIADLLWERKQIIFYGPLGTGKTYLARELARQDLIGKNVVELVDLPTGQPGRPSRAMTEERAGKVLKVAVGRDSSFVKVVKLGKNRYGATTRRAKTASWRAGTGHGPMLRRRRSASS